MPIDLDAMRARLRRSAERLEGRDDRDAVERALRERARRLAARDNDAHDPAIVAHVVAVRRARSLLGFPILRVGEVRDVRVTRLPRLDHRHHVCGLFQLRGQVHCLVDIQPFIGASEELQHGDITLAVLVEGPHGPLGVRVDEVLGVRAIDARELDPSERERRLAFVSCVTRDCVEVIDVDMLFASAELSVGRG